MNQNYIQFTEEMKETYTILIPNMLPLHFKLVRRILENYGYTVVLLETSGPHIAETGQKYVHNDTCYPAITRCFPGNMTRTNAPSCSSRPVAAAARPTMSPSCGRLWRTPECHTSR